MLCIALQYNIRVKPGTICFGYSDLLMMSGRSLPVLVFNESVSLDFSLRL